MSATLAGPPASCCWTGVKHTGTPEGRVEPLGGMNTYIAEPPAGATSGGHKVLLFLADVWGPLFLNNKLLQDYFASFGFIVLGPDYFFGLPIQDLPEDRDKAAWSVEALATAKAALPKWFDAVRAKYGSTETTRYTAAGYCFGAPFVFDLAAQGSIVAGAIVHPAFLEESHFENLARPLLLSCSEDDFTFPLDKRRRAEDIMVANKSSYYFQVFSHVAHGFAVRGNPDVLHERWAKEESARGIKDWFLWYSA